MAESFKPFVQFVPKLKDESWDEYMARRYQLLVEEIERREETTNG